MQTFLTNTANDIKSIHEGHLMKTVLRAILHPSDRQNLDPECGLLPRPRTQAPGPSGGLSDQASVGTRCGGSVGNAVAKNLSEKCFLLRSLDGAIFTGLSPGSLGKRHLLRRP